jgi:hypothetical protein
MDGLYTCQQANCKGNAAAKPSAEVKGVRGNAAATTELHQRIKEKTDFPEAGFNPSLSQSVDVTKGRKTPVMR